MAEEEDYVVEDGLPQPKPRPRKGCKDHVLGFTQDKIAELYQVGKVQIVRRRSRIAILIAIAVMGLLFFQLGREHQKGRIPDKEANPTNGTNVTNPKQEPQLIPKIIHQTWKTKTLPFDVVYAAESWTQMNPDYDYRFYTDDDIDKHMRKNHEWILPAWDRMKPIEKADLFRYAILHDVGGIYADIDVTCSRPVDEWLRNTGDYYNVDLIVGFEVATDRPDWRKWFARKFQITQWAMAGIAKHPVFWDIMLKIDQFFKDHTDEERNEHSVVDTTGPGPWSDSVMEFLDKQHGMKWGEGHFTKEVAAERFNHIGRVLMLPIRSFSLASAGYELKPHHSMDDVFLRHGFKGSWKKGAIPDNGQGKVVSLTLDVTCRQAGDIDERQYCSTGNSPTNEGPENLFDRSKYTKWLTFHTFDSTRETAPKKSPHVTYEACLRVNDTEKTCQGQNKGDKFSVSWYNMTCAKDSPERDPKNWILQGMEEDGNWTTIDYRQDIKFPNRSTTLHFALNQSWTYAKYKLTVLAVAEALQADSVQLAELRLENIQPPPPEKPKCTQFGNMSVCVCCGHMPSAEGVGNLIDEFQDTKMLLQPKYLNEYGYNITFTTNTSRLAAAYSVQSANDFPARDPSAWSLSARDNEDEDWALLDIRYNMTFVNRFQVFVMSFEDSPQAIKATTIGFKQYRFTILESYDTKKKQCSAPFCVQVAEFALHEPGSVPTTSTVTTTTTLEAPWADKLSIENWPEIATDQEFKVYPGGTVTWVLSRRANLISGTPEHPTLEFGFLKNKEAFGQYSFRFKEEGSFPFFTSKNGVKGTILVGGPVKTLPTYWPIYGFVDAWPEEPLYSKNKDWEIKIRKGGTVVWELNQSCNLIAGTPEDPSDDWGFLLPESVGYRYEHTFPKEGEFPFFSSSNGQKGKVLVGGPTTSTTSTTTTETTSTNTSTTSITTSVTTDTTQTSLTTTLKTSTRTTAIPLTTAKPVGKAKKYKKVKPTTKAYKKRPKSTRKPIA
eukprot:m.25251 g.25251  ORF g.25251 m.25251 type:complete len:1001 (+) comp7690_c0_seq1:225-3227(+)